MANQPGGCIKNQITVHNVVHPYRFTKDMLAGMRVLRQLDDKFIVGILSQEGKRHGMCDNTSEPASHREGAVLVTCYMLWFKFFFGFFVSLCFRFVIIF